MSKITVERVTPHGIEAKVTHNETGISVQYKHHTTYKENVEVATRILYDVIEKINELQSNILTPKSKGNNTDD